MASKTRRVRKPASAGPDVRAPSKRQQALKLITGAKNIDSIPLMETNLQPTRYVPTIFPSFNRAIVLGGAPIRCIWAIHGPYGGGKSALAIGIVNSFIQQGHFGAYLDAEHAVSKKWFGQLGAYMKDTIFEQPDNFEHAIDLVDTWIGNFRDGKRKGDIPEDRALCIVVDTIHKLAPKKEIAKLSGQKGEENMDKGWGRYRANMCTSWLDHLTPLVGKNDVAFLALAQEREKESSTDFWASADQYTVKGGQAILYDASVRARVTLATKIFEERGKKKILVEREHAVRVMKNKVGYPEEMAKIFISNGRGKAPIGFDIEREAVVEALNRGGILDSSCAWYTLPSGDRFQGMDNLIDGLRADPDLFDEFLSYLSMEDESCEDTDE